MKKTKQKTKKAAVKRFKVTKTGKVLHRGHGVRHLKSTKTKRRLRSQKRVKQLKGKYKLNVKRMLGK
ncbi:MAG: 50S ribosomal protein L35 [Candidatus Paceibacterota bacterium]